MPMLIFRSKEIRVYNSATGSLNPITWTGIRDYGVVGWHKYPDPDMKWTPSIRFITNKLWFTINWILLHVFPAYLIDLGDKMKGNKPRLVAYNIS